MKRFGLIASLVFLSLFILVIPTFAQVSLDSINQKVCDKFEEDLNRLAAIMEEYRRREGILETRVAFGNVDTPVEMADYQITYAAEALAYQRAQKPNSVGGLKSSLQNLASKIIRAKTEVNKVLNLK